jgi:hypothetical protein
MWADLVPALRALLVALAGIQLALWWLHGTWYLSVGLLIGVALLGMAVEWVGDRMLPSKPVAAVLVMEWWVLVPMAIATAASTGLILLGIKLAVPDSVKDTVVKQTSTALVSGLTAFLTAAFISAVGDRDKSAVGERIRKRMQAHYERTPGSGGNRISKMNPGGAAEQFLYSDFYDGLSGWGRETRISRARGIAETKKVDNILQLSGARPSE